VGGSSLLVESFGEFKKKKQPLKNGSNGFSSCRHILNVYDLNASWKISLFVVTICRL
jgi:hypothetical protein